MAFQIPVTIGRALERIERHSYLLPAIQREFVWKTDQIARLFDSLMQGYPIGSFLFWSVAKEHSKEFVLYEFMTNYHQRTSSHLKRFDLAEPRDITAILDGQQRLTALNIGLRGSHAEKLPRKRVDNMTAYPRRRLFLNLAQPADDNELGMEFDFRFLTKESAQDASKDDHHWFLVSQILKMESGSDLFDYVVDANLAVDKFAFRSLSRLHDIVHKEPIINYFEEESQDLDKVLNIFIRANSGGSPLTYSDLLLSIATAQWRDVEAREVIHGLVDELNDFGQGFDFSKDLVLKAGLVLTNTPSIAFRVTNFNAANMAALESNWPAISDALRIAVRLLADFGFSDRTLTADSVVIPIAYYLHRRQANESYLTSDSVQKDRERIRGWTVRSLLKPGVWGSGLDTLLLNLRNVLQAEQATVFPVAELELAMTRLGKSLRFEEDEIQDLLSLSYGDKRVFPLLSLLYPGMDFRNEFHIDHVFPQSSFKKKRLMEAGVSEEDVDEFTTLMNQLPNLQLLEGPINHAKLDKLPKTWLNTHYLDQQARDAYCARHDLGTIPETLAEFPGFHAARQARIGHRLRPLLELGVSPL